MASPVGALAAWLATAPSRSFQGAAAALTTRPSWPFAFGAAVALLKAGAWLVPRHVGAARLLTDHAIPSFLLPPGVHVVSRVLVAPAGESSDGDEDEPALFGEVITPTAAHADDGPPWPATVAAVANGGHFSGDIPSPPKARMHGMALALPLAPGTIILYAHGGAYCLCSPSTHRRLLAELCVRTGCQVVSVDYRRPPEHRCPTAVNDVLRAYAHLTEVTRDCSPQRFEFRPGRCEETKWRKKRALTSLTFARAFPPASPRFVFPLCLPSLSTSTST
jgi:hypothetical protein